MDFNVEGLKIQKFYSSNIQFSVHCPETSCTNVRLYNFCWLTNIYQCLSSKVKPII